MGMGAGVFETGLDLGTIRLQAYPYSNKPYTHTGLFLNFLRQIEQYKCCHANLEFKKGLKPSHSPLSNETTMIIVFYDVCVPKWNSKYLMGIGEYKF